MSLNANEDNDCQEDPGGEFGGVTTAYTDCGLDESDTGVEVLMGGAED